MSFKKISSQQNPLFKQWLSLQDSRGIKKHSQCLVGGRKIVPELLSQNLSPQAIIVAEGMAPPPSDTQAEIFELRSFLFRQLDLSGTNYPLLVMDVPEIPSWEPNAPLDGLELLLALGDPVNLGAVIRVATAFDVKRIVLLKECAHPFHPKVVSGSAGTVFYTPFLSGPSIKELKPDPSMIALDMTGENLADFQWPTKARLIVGEEGLGLPENIEGIQKVTIPMNPKVESLNATVAASLALFTYLHFGKRIG